MTELKSVLEGNDLGFFRMVAGLWGIELAAPDAFTAQVSLAQAMRDTLLASEIIETLPAEAKTALQALWENDGIMPWAQFSRSYGEVREMGSARRDRERPDLNPVSPIEMLWYRALIGRHFLHFPPADPQEYACIPDEILEAMPSGRGARSRPPGRPASPAEFAHPYQAGTRILDHATTLLAMLRTGLDPAGFDTSGWNPPLAFIEALLHAAGLTNTRGQPVRETAGAFIEAPRPQALAQLASAWMTSKNLNDLYFVPGLKFEGEWRNSPDLARQAVMDILSRVPQDTWWSLNSFVSAVRENQPDFQRTAGDYDSWFVRRVADGVLLRGISSWDEVDGALLRFYITGPLHWLGILELASPEKGAPSAAFRFSPWSSALWHGKAPEVKARPDEPLKVLSDGTILAGARSSRVARYQAARFSEWLAEKGDTYAYRLTPASLARAAKQGLKVSQLLALLKRHSAGLVPPTLVQALERWEKFGMQAGMERAVILRVTSTEILAALRQSKAARYLGDQLNPTTVTIKPGGEEAVRKALADLGHLLDASQLEDGL
jgi:hypothetical protein